MTTHLHPCRRRAIALALGVGAALPDPARAAPRAAPEGSAGTDAEPGQGAEADALGAEGVAAFSAGEHDRAIALFERSYALDPKPNLIFNIGRVYEEKGELARALELYSKFVVEPGVDLPTRELAAERIRAIRVILDQLAEDRPDPSESGPPRSATQQDTPGSVADASADASAAAARGKVRAMRIAGFSSLGGGVAMLAVGGALGGVARRRVSLANGEPIIEHADQRRREARPFARAADAMFVIGGAVALAGVVLVVVGYTGARRRDVAVAPRGGPTYAGLVMEGRF